MSEPTPPQQPDWNWREQSADWCAERLEKMGAKGLVISVACGPCGPERHIHWSVNALNTYTLGELRKTFAGHSFQHAVWIAEAECIAMGWLVPRTPALHPSRRRRDPSDD